MAEATAANAKGKVASGAGMGSGLVAGPYATAYRYTDRPTKGVYISKKYEPILRGSVLDVGCDAAPLRHLVARQDEYVGVDMRADADVVLNLDHDTRADGTILPFGDRSFDTVLCTDVLEHLDRCHGVFDELCRVARDRVIVSLPNPLGNMVEALKQGTGGRMKYYGLPVDPPSDRHRWFFGFEEAAAFMGGRGVKNGFAVEQLDIEYTQDHYWYVEPDCRDVLDSLNVKAGTSWCVLKRDR
jgi:hypothetical protein